MSLDRCVMAGPVVRPRRFSHHSRRAPFGDAQAQGQQKSTSRSPVALCSAVMQSRRAHEVHAGEAPAPPTPVWSPSLGTSFWTRPLPAVALAWKAGPGRRGRRCHWPRGHSGRAGGCGTLASLPSASRTLPFPSAFPLCSVLMAVRSSLPSPVSAPLSSVASLQPSLPPRLQFLLTQGQQASSLRSQAVSAVVWVPCTPLWKAAGGHLDRWVWLCTSETMDKTGGGWVWVQAPGVGPRPSPSLPRTLLRGVTAAMVAQSLASPLSATAGACLSPDGRRLGATHGTGSWESSPSSPEPAHLRASSVSSDVEHVLIPTETF